MLSGFFEFCVTGYMFCKIRSLFPNNLSRFSLEPSCLQVRDICLQRRGEYHRISIELRYRPFPPVSEDNFDQAIYRETTYRDVADEKERSGSSSTQHNHNHRTQYNTKNKKNEPITVG